jgi:tetratricopeptide (TPR) repeat protein
MAERAPDFFISRAGADAPFAAEIGRILEDAGHSVVLQQWDFANRNFIERMHAALASRARVIALLSNDYQASDHCTAEWQNAIAHDPLNRQGRLIVLRVAETTPTGLLTALAYWDLVPVRGDRALLRDILLIAVKPGCHKDSQPAAQYWRAPRPIVHPGIQPTPSFTGREAELSWIRELLWAGHTAAVTQPVAAHGLGGIGKSVLVREYAHRNRDDYAGVWWLNAATPEDGTSGFEGVEQALVELGATFIRGLDEVEERAKAARRTLELIAHGGFEKPWLLIYDNVDDGRVLREWVPIGNAHVLVTSRLSGWPRTVRTVEIDEWELSEASGYLLKESGRADLTEKDAAEIAEALGRLPLALSHAAALLRARSTITAASYIASLARRMSKPLRDAEYPRAVFATFQEAIAEAEREAKGARVVISLAAFFAPDDIPEDLFAPLAEFLTDDGLADALGALDHLSLADFDPQKRSFSVHRLVQAAARSALGDKAPAWSNCALLILRSAFPMPEFRTWPVCERLVSHVRAVALHVTEDSGALAWLLGTTGIYLEARAALEEVVPLHERARAIFERLAARDPGNTEWQHSLAVSLKKIGDVQIARGNLGSALGAYDNSRAICEKLVAQDPGNAESQRYLSVSHADIGIVLEAQGNFEAALTQYHKALEIQKPLAAQDPGDAGRWRDLSVTFAKIGDVQRARCNLDGALKAYKDSLAIAEKLVAHDVGNAQSQYDLGISHERIGDALRAQGELDRALAAYARKHEIIAALTAQDPGNADWQRDLSVSHVKIAEIAEQTAEGSEARAHYQAALKIAAELHASGRLVPRDAWIVGDLEARLAKLPPETAGQ